MNDQEALLDGWLDWDYYRVDPVINLRHYKLKGRFATGLRSDIPIITNPVGPDDFCLYSYRPWMRMLTGNRPFRQGFLFLHRYMRG